MKYRSFSFKSLAVLSSIGVVAALTSTPSHAQTRIVSNGFNGGIASAWRQIEPVAESGVAFEGSGSAQINEGGSMTRTFDVDRNTEYRVTVRVRGGGRLRVRWDGNNRSTRVTSPSNEWQERVVEFNSADATSIDVSLEFNGQEGRFDALEIFDLGSGSSSSSSSSSSTSSSSSSGSSSSGSANATGSILNFRKRNEQFSIDGAGGAQLGIQIYLWNTSLTNVN